MHSHTLTPFMTPLLRTNTHSHSLWTHCYPFPLILNPQLRTHHCLLQSTNNYYLLLGKSNLPFASFPHEATTTRFFQLWRLYNKLSSAMNKLLPITFYLNTFTNNYFPVWPDYHLLKLIINSLPSTATCYEVIISKY